MDDKSETETKECSPCAEDKGSSSEQDPVKAEDNDRKRSAPDDDNNSSDVPEKRAKIDDDAEKEEKAVDSDSKSKDTELENKPEDMTVKDMTAEDSTTDNKTDDKPKEDLINETKKEDSDVAEDKKNSEENVSDDCKVNDKSGEKEASSEKTQADVPYLNGGDDVSSSKSGGSDSEKENCSRANDASSGNRKAKSDIITLSDESDEDSHKNDKMVDMNVLDEITPEEIKLRKKIIKRLQGELRNEEAKLVLLKKLRQSQLSHQIPDNTSDRPKNNSIQHPGAPPPLVRGQQGSGAALKHAQSNHNGHHSQSLSHQTHSSQMQARQSAHGPPPLVNMAPRVSNHHSLSQHHGINRNMIQNQGHRGNMTQIMPGYRQNHVQPSPQHVTQRQEEQQTPAQRQAAAKLALRKQLEKTLLQIPPPKPPPPEMNFIPSLASPDFIILLGLEEVVNFIIDSQLIARGQKNPDEKFVCNPFSCVQCGADFTPVWKREKPGSKNVICEHCVTSNQKKALKQEHTNRLKSAFVKALQQEQEIERMQAQSLTQASSHPVAVTTTAAVPSVASPIGISSSSVMNLTSYKPSPEQLRQHQNFIQAHQAQLRAGSTLGLPFVQRGPFPYQLPFTKPSDIQRQYFLDLLPRGGNMSWKS